MGKVEGKFRVDDLSTGVCSYDENDNLSKKLTINLQEAKFNARKWRNNREMNFIQIYEIVQ